MTSSPKFKLMYSSDVDYLFSLCESSMRGYIEAIAGTWNAGAVRAGLLAGLEAGGFRGIIVDNVRVGALAFETHATHIQIEQLFIKKEFQNVGTGTLVLQGIIDQARMRGKPVRLRVLSSNPAKALFDRLGFVTISQTYERYFMEYPAAPLQ
jgi:ribosomal protein S18 acetylase RimI-like enzyme